MIRILCHLSVAVLSLASACAELTLETLRKRQEQMRTTIRTAMPSVVGIEFPNAGDGSGSGVIVSADGLILTAAHVSGESNRDITVIMLGGERLPGKTLGAYRSLDAGMIQVEVNNRSFPHVPLGDATALEQGQWCLAIGHPGGFVKDRTPPVRLSRLLSLEENGFLLTDSTLVGGHSGGPLLDLQGRLIGIHSSIGISLSENRHAPISAFKDQWKLMQRGKVVGRLYDWNRREQGFLGTQIDPQSETADVLSVVEGSPAQISGIRKGDRIVILDGRPVRHGRRFLQRLRYFKPNDKVTLEVKRAVSDITESLTIKLKRRSDFLNEPNH